MDSIIESWVSKKFVVMDDYFEEDPSKILILLVDHLYWSKNRIKLYKWCCKNNLKYRVTDDFLVIENEKELVQFYLKWS